MVVIEGGELRFISGNCCVNGGSFEQFSSIFKVVRAECC